MHVLSHMCVFIKVKRIFSAKSSSLGNVVNVCFLAGNLSLLTNVQKLFTVSNAVSNVAYVFIKRCYACSTVIRIAYCRDGQSSWLKATLRRSGLADR